MTVLAILVAPVAFVTAEDAGITLREVSTSWGVDFEHRHGGSGRRFMVETMVGGVVILDFDGDGDEDLFFVDGGVLPGYSGPAPRSRLFRNDGGIFVDHTDRSGLAPESYGSGAVAGDYDGDGDVDLYLTAFGSNSLWSNRGDGGFVDTTGAAGVGETAWSTGAVFSDFDRDGDLDLYVANYVDFSLDNHKFCGNAETGLTGYCSPEKYEGVADVYYRNEGEGVFVRATREAGLSGPASAGMGVVAGDLDGDGWPDLYVANDLDPNLLFRNIGDGTFEDISLLSGAAYGDRAGPEAGMGVDLGDVDGDGQLDIVVTNFELETNALYRNMGGGLFTDARFASRVAETSLVKLAFGVDLLDLDHDADLDLLVANGHILDNAEALESVSPYAQPNQVFENLGDGRFVGVENSGFEVASVSRGLAVGDLDQDGDLDVVLSNSNSRASVWENGHDGERDWLQLDLVGAAGSASGVGARVRLTGDGVTQMREVRTGSSYLSQNALTLHFGLGAAVPAAADLEVDWPSGRRQRLRVPPGVRVRLVEPVAPRG